MIQFDTKFNIGDMVRVPTIEPYPEKITCPYCKGEDYVTTEDGDKIECEMCENGIYKRTSHRKVWSSAQKVTGAVMGRDFRKKLCPPIVEICTSGGTLVHSTPEYDVRFEYEVKMGDPVDENNKDNP